MITGISYDSGSVEKGSLFFALPGIHTDGHDYIPQAVSRGASGIVHVRPVAEPVQGITYIQVEDPRAALSPVSAAFYDYPSRDLHIIGVTGTDGKSTTVSFIYQLLSLLGENTGFLSTVHFVTESSIRKNPFRQSTPEASEIQAILRTMADNGKKYAVIEATSHGLSPKNNRLGDISFDTAVFTNLSHEHLEFHGTFSQYRKDKVRLFHMLDQEDNQKRKRFAVINRDDANAGFFRDGTDKPVFSFSMKNKDADLFAAITASDISGTSFSLMYNGAEEPAFLPIPGLFHVEDLLAATLTVCRLLDIPLNRISRLFPSLNPVPGRLQPVRMGQPFSVFVDYAHTPGSFEKLFPKIRSWTSGKLIILFGSAGERDFEKRARQGEIADKFADIILLTDEDPRGEASVDILNDIQKGCTARKQGETLFCIPDRKTAIEKALSLARAEDTVLFLGKGHESSIIYKNGPLPWNEVETVKELLCSFGFSNEEGPSLL